MFLYEIDSATNLGATNLINTKILSSKLCVYSYKSYIGDLYFDNLWDVLNLRNYVSHIWELVLTINLA